MYRHDIAERRALRRRQRLWPGLEQLMQKVGVILQRLDERVEFGDKRVTFDIVHAPTIRRPYLART